jgi:hypothetical protein
MVFFVFKICFEYHSQVLGSALNNNKKGALFFRNFFFQKIIFCMVKKKILGNIRKIWHLLKGNISK